MNPGEIPGLSWIEVPQPCPIEWIDQALPLLDRYERDRYCSYTHKEAGEMFLMGRFFIKTQLSSLMSCPGETLCFTLSSKGKPYLEGSGYHFSLSHTGRWLGFIVSRQGPVGMDLETVKKRDYLKLAERFFSPSEQEWLKEDEKDRSRRFYQIWTQKEALLKATGDGLSLKTLKLTVPCVSGSEKSGSLLIKNFYPSPEIIGAVAVQEQEAE